MNVIKREWRRMQSSLEDVKVSKNCDALVRVGLQKKVQDEHLYLWISTLSNLEHVPLGYI